MCRAQNRYVLDGVEILVKVQSLPVTSAWLLHQACIAGWPNAKHALEQCRYSKSRSYLHLGTQAGSSHTSSGMWS